jgi:hypothetical protein
VAARLEHEQAAEVIEPLTRLAPLGEEGGAGNRRIAGHDGLNGEGVGVDDILTLANLNKNENTTCAISSIPMAE